MNKLQIQVLNTTPAQINFNYDEISKQLDEVLKKYTGITITEDTIKDGKKVIADLRKGKKSLDEFRKKTKKELTKSVTEFENQCKELNRKFDEVINPINEQAEQFEIKRKEEKKMEVEKVIKEVCKLKDVDNLPLEDSYLNKSTSLKSIKEDLIKVADNILLQQATLKANEDLIKSKIEVINTKYNLNLVSPPYVSILEYTDVQNVLEQIENDAESLKNKLNSTPKQQTQVVEKPNKNEEIFIDVYEIEGTEKQLDMLEDFLNTNGYKWTTIKED
ncbi:DUF1351 domain-containing protein [Clostridium botulinum]|uniref:DUF1351 domain-containing protein n=1 Tax=Clostridium botulinum CFSAN001627 TaxID=1232189 RepID=M1ZVR3_CLOBO|nr:DUF1351 domain-containing protein [Clostridium botulinum]EKN40883.1 hypothetical protein CFSAN001627_16713 [Clostridium botulinum CFSAN001627]APC85474.1 hypothetical protein NPD12_1466 [Clostridium botulinum]AXG95376.1 DUF1351 domain-containing protein [Clostridium botulinum]EDT82841.1 putative phage protein [Clostridium botulinum NCTC 2916]MBY6770514.1 DUF1351 domain-containing protein [Clostridium botulinum]